MTRHESSCLDEQISAVVRYIVIMKLKAVSRVDGETLHEENVAVVFPQACSAYMGGRNLTRFDEPLNIGYHLRMSTMNNRIYPNALSQTVKPSESLYWLRLKLHQVAYELKTEHVETIECHSREACKAFLDAMPKDSIGPLWQGRYD